MLQLRGMLVNRNFSTLLVPVPKPGASSEADPTALPWLGGGGAISSHLPMSGRTAIEQAVKKISSRPFAYFVATVPGPAVGAGLAPPVSTEPRLRSRGLSCSSFSALEYSFRPSTLMAMVAKVQARIL